MSRLIDVRSSAVIALGGNLPSAIGAPAQTLAAAIAAMAQAGLTVSAISRFFRTPCFPAGAGPDFVNAAVCVTSDYEPREILQKLHAIERQFGRTRTLRWGVRTLDLDLLAVGDRVLPDRETYERWRHLPDEQQASMTPDRLILPHPRLQDRGFALIPMRDIVPSWTHPILGRNVAQMCDALAPDEIGDVTPL